MLRTTSAGLTPGKSEAVSIFSVFCRLGYRVLTRIFWPESFLFVPRNDSYPGVNARPYLDDAAFSRASGL